MRLKVEIKKQFHEHSEFTETCIESMLVLSVSIQREIFDEIPKHEIYTR